MIAETVRDYAAMSSVGASVIFADAMASLANGRRYNLGLATGNTMITLYTELAAKFRMAKAARASHPQTRNKVKEPPAPAVSF